MRYKQETIHTACTAVQKLNYVKSIKYDIILQVFAVYIVHATVVYVRVLAVSFTLSSTFIYMLTYI